MLPAAEAPGLGSECTKGTSLWPLTGVRRWSFLIQHRAERCQPFIFLAEIWGLLFSFITLHTSKWKCLLAAVAVAVKPVDDRVAFHRASDC